jgi:hypothetical protein
MRGHFHSFGHARLHEEETPPPAWISKVPPLRHVWVASASSSVIADFGVVVVLLLVLLLRGLWRLSGALAARFGRD